MKLLLAPLMGITTLHFRRTYHEQFPYFDGALAPFLSITPGFKRSSNRNKDIDPDLNRNTLPLEPQVLGKEGEDFKEMARCFREDLGYTRINWNIGCPSGTVCAKKRGAGILPYPELIRNFLEQACAQDYCELTVKTRLGMKRNDEWQALAGLFNEFPIKELCIHPRTGIQQYEGRADRQAFRDFAAEIRKPLIYNGDLYTLEDVQEVMNLGIPLEGLMLGRGCLADPWLPGRIRAYLGLNTTQTPEFPALGSPEFREGLAAFHDTLARLYLEAGKKTGGSENPGLMLGRLKELWQYWILHIADKQAEQKKLLKSRSLEEYWFWRKEILP